MKEKSSNSQQIVGVLVYQWEKIVSKKMSNRCDEEKFSYNDLVQLIPSDQREGTQQQLQKIPSKIIYIRDFYVKKEFQGMIQVFTSRKIEFSTNLSRSPKLANFQLSATESVFV